MIPHLRMFIPWSFHCHHFGVHNVSWVRAALGCGAMEGMSALLEDTFSFEISQNITSVTSEWNYAYLQRDKNQLLPIWISSISENIIFSYEIPVFHPQLVQFSH